MRVAKRTYRILNIGDTQSEIQPQGMSQEQLILPKW